MNSADGAIVVFWGALYSGPWFQVTAVAWSNVSQHGLNSFFALFELIISRTLPPPALHLLFLIIFLALYLGLAYLTHAVQGWYPYTFLDPAAGHRVAYIFGILAAIIVVFLVVALLIWVRKWVTEKKLRLTGRFRKGEARIIDSGE
ncbi:MAG: hypothetical protein M1812_002915 [Candelaria pacifica]|nr:MAG: hypothetical protein M1812_002915 [Candelaria pacifica]